MGRESEIKEIRRPPYKCLHTYTNKRNNKPIQKRRKVYNKHIRQTNYLNRKGEGDLIEGPRVRAHIYNNKYKNLKGVLHRDSPVLSGGSINSNSSGRSEKKSLKASAQPAKSKETHAD